jgi:hypothetical protein
MNIAADLAGTDHYQGWSIYDPETGTFRVDGDGYNSWSGGYNSWSGGYNSWSGGYNSWSGGYNSWSGGYNSWSGGYSSWAGGYNSWSGGYNSWSGSVGDPAWAATFAGLLNLPNATSAVGMNNWVDGD